MTIVRGTRKGDSLNSEDGKTFEDYRDVISYLMNEKGYGRGKIAKELGIHVSRARRWMNRIRYENHENENAEHNVKLTRQNQALLDKNRVNRKILRENVRVGNAVEEYSQELIRLFKDVSLSDLTVEHDQEGQATAIVQLSDTHFNELIDIVGNRFDFSVGCKRMAYFAKRIKQYLVPFNVKNVMLAITGDLLNSDRRLDELLSKATNRSSATFLVVDILQQFILDLNKTFNVSVACVTGNESRVNDELGWVADVASDNYDFTVFNILKYLFKDADGITFVSGDPVEMVIEIAGQNVLLLHGNGSIKKDVVGSVQQIVGRYASKGKRIDFVIFGHIHCAFISDMFARSGSLCGDNAYGEYGLNLVGRASQNLHIFHGDGSRDSIRIDLQEPSCDGYNMESALEAYSPTRASKRQEETTIFKVMI